MPKQEGQKSKLLTLLRILEQKTDEEHLLNVPQLVELLEQQDILAERKSIYSDIDTLRSLGYDIQLRRGRGGGWRGELVFGAPSALEAGRVRPSRWGCGGTWVEAWLDAVDRRLSAVGTSQGGAAYSTATAAAVTRACRYAA